MKEVDALGGLVKEVGNGAGGVAPFRRTVKLLLTVGIGNTIS